jgi:hypothetical protein
VKITPKGRTQHQLTYGQLHKISLIFADYGSARHGTFLEVLGLKHSSDQLVDCDKNFRAGVRHYRDKANASKPIDTDPLNRG